MKTRRSKKIILIALVMVILITMLNPMRRSPENIRERMLGLTPVGTNMEDVIKFINNKHKWEIRNISEESGYWIGWRYPSDSFEHPLIGVKSIRAFIGDYQTWLIVTISVEVMWGFDEDGKLIDIDVRKHMMK